MACSITTMLGMPDYCDRTINVKLVADSASLAMSALSFTTKREKMKLDDCCYGDISWECATLADEQHTVAKNATIDHDFQQRFDTATYHTIQPFLYCRYGCQDACPSERDDDGNSK